MSTISSLSEDLKNILKLGVLGVPKVGRAEGPERGVGEDGEFSEETRRLEIFKSLGDDEFFLDEELFAAFWNCWLRSWRWEGSIFSLL